MKRCLYFPLAALLLAGLSAPPGVYSQGLEVVAPVGPQRGFSDDVISRAGAAGAESGAAALRGITVGTVTAGAVLGAAAAAAFLITSGSSVSNPTTNEQDVTTSHH